MALVRNLVDGCIESIDLVFTEDGVIMNAMGRQLRNSSRSEVCTQVCGTCFCLCKMVSAVLYTEVRVLINLAIGPGY